MKKLSDNFFWSKFYKRQIRDNIYKTMEDITSSNSHRPEKGLVKWEDTLFSSGPYDLYIFKKSEKLCSAVHFVTNYFNEREPIRFSLREASIQALSLSLSFIRNENLELLIEGFSSKLVEVQALLQTAYFSGLMSEMNFNILRDEIDNLLGATNKKRKTSFSLPMSFLDVPPPEIRDEYKGHSIGQQNHTLAHRLETINTQNLRSNFDRSEQTERNMERHILKKPSQDQSNSERINKILGLLKDKKERTIKDFSNSIKGCSEKTLQRELLRLVAEGKIIKRGERRWSRYSLANL